MPTRVYVIHSLTPMHVGVGQGSGLIDLPIAREVATSHPIVPGSSVKGVLRASATDDGEDSNAWKLFGPDTANASKHSGALRFSDARLLCLPAQTDTGVFAWVTCPLALHRLHRDAPRVLPKTPVPSPDDDSAMVVTRSVIADANGQVHLVGLPLNRQPLDKAWSKALAELIFDAGDPWADLFSSRLAVISNETFTWLAESHTEVRAHIRINNDSGTVERGALWYEESLPAESILVGLVQGANNGRVKGDEALKSLQAMIQDTPLQFGGNATTGMGRARFTLRG